MIGRTIVWCSIVSNNGDLKAIIMLTIHYILVWTVIVINILYNYKIKSILMIEIGDDIELVSRYLNRLRWFPIVLIIFALPSTFNKMLYFITGDYFYIGLLLRAVADGLGGLGISMIFLSHPAVYKSVFDCVMRMFSRKKEEENINSVLDSSFTSDKSLLSRGSIQ